MLTGKIPREDIPHSLTEKADHLIIRIAPNVKAKKEKNISSLPIFKAILGIVFIFIILAFTGGLIFFSIQDDTFGFNPKSFVICGLFILFLFIFFIALVSIGLGGYDQIVSINKKEEFVEIKENMINHSYQIPFSQIKAFRLYRSRYSNGSGSSENSNYGYLDSIDLILDNGNLIWIYTEKTRKKSSKFPEEILKKLKSYLDVPIIDETSSNLSDKRSTEYQKGERVYTEVQQTNVRMLDEEDLLGIKFKQKRPLKYKFAIGTIQLFFFSGVTAVIGRMLFTIWPTIPLLFQVILLPLAAAFFGFVVFAFYYNPVRVEVAILNNELLISTKTKFFIGPSYYKRKYRVSVSNVIDIDISRSNHGTHSLNLIFADNEKNQIPKRITSSIGPPDLETLERAKDYLGFSIWEVELTNMSNITLADLMFIRDVMLKRLDISGE